ncbi:peptide chain release factor N(5)-glutamine methyltransferase [Spiroplasma endosymbiont of Anurida maritima]|uniref:peptide chain release factor N(5)-glutamine methyltransferase n=1 Tax=Spiroplasma endosymbiont of Anurida maritima TaxID=2967972 RepID=UPI0036D43023
MKKSFYKLLKNIPLHYVVGKKEIEDLTLYLNKSTLIPRDETIELIYKTFSKINNKKSVRILEIGTGSGVISLQLGILLKHANISYEIVATDISNKALKIAKKNQKVNNVENIFFVKSNIFDKIDNKFDVIISNPPYIDKNDPHISKIVKKYEPKKALFAKNQGLYFYQEIFKNAFKYLNKNYLICFEHGFKQKEDLLKTIKNQKFFALSNIIFEKDLSNKDRFLFVNNL